MIPLFVSMPALPRLGQPAHKLGGSAERYPSVPNFRIPQLRIDIALFFANALQYYRHARVIRHYGCRFAAVMTDSNPLYRYFGFFNFRAGE
jgi:hypothetical protein